MSKKEFPMPDKYNKQAAKLLELLEIRDKINKELEFMTPERLAAGSSKIRLNSIKRYKILKRFSPFTTEVHQMQSLVETEMSEK